MRLTTVAVLISLLPACTANIEDQFIDQVQRLADEVLPNVERAAGLEFKYPPAVAVRSKEEVTEFLQLKMQTDFPPEELERVSIAYQLFRLIPEDLDLRSLLIDLYSEQVVGYYDPSTDSLYVVDGTDPLQVRLVVAHELVHALQAQYVNLDSILTSDGDNDRRVAAQAVFEGQGMLASVVAILPDRGMMDLPDFWTEYRATIRAEQENMPVLGAAPLVLREGLIFPYLGGADFVRWFGNEHPGQVPFGELMPQSTEQILHPERYAENDQPIRLSFIDTTGVYHSDGLGEFETRILLTELSGNESTGAARARDWGGDRFAIFPVEDSYALVWWSVWDNAQAARRFATVFKREWERGMMTGRAFRVLEDQVGHHAAVVLIDAPDGWSGLERPPQVRVVGN